MEPPEKDQDAPEEEGQTPLTEPKAAQAEVMDPASTALIPIERLEADAANPEAPVERIRLAVALAKQHIALSKAQMDHEARMAAMKIKAEAKGASFEEGRRRQKVKEKERREQIAREAEAAAAKAASKAAAEAAASKAAAEAAASKRHADHVSVRPRYQGRSLPRIETAINSVAIATAIAAVAMMVAAAIKHDRDTNAAEHKRALSNPYGSRNFAVGPEYLTRKALGEALAEKLDLLLGEEDFAVVGNIPAIDRRYRVNYHGFDISVERDGAGRIMADCNNCCDMDAGRDSLVEDPEYVFCAGTESAVFAGLGKGDDTLPYTELVQSFSDGERSMADNGSDGRLDSNLLSLQDMDGCPEEVAGRCKLLGSDRILIDDFDRDSPGEFDRKLGKWNELLDRALEERNRRRQSFYRPRQSI